MLSFCDPSCQLWGFSHYSHLEIICVLLLVHNMTTWSPVDTVGNIYVKMKSTLVNLYFWTMDLKYFIANSHHFSTSLGGFTDAEIDNSPLLVGKGSEKDSPLRE